MREREEREKERETDRQTDREGEKEREKERERERERERELLAARHDVGSNKAIEQLHRQMKARLAEAEFEVHLDQPVYKGLAHLGVDLLKRRHRVVADRAKRQEECRS
jgi:hypothetical protein